MRSFERMAPLRRNPGNICSFTSCIWTWATFLRFHLRATVLIACVKEVVPSHNRQTLVYSEHHVSWGLMSCSENDAIRITHSCFSFLLVQRGVQLQTKLLDCGGISFSVCLSGCLSFCLSSGSQHDNILSSQGESDGRSPRLVCIVKLVSAQGLSP